MTALVRDLEPVRETQSMNRGNDGWLPMNWFSLKSIQLKFKTSGKLLFISEKSMEHNNNFQRNLYVSINKVTSLCSLILTLCDLHERRDNVVVKAT